MNWIKNWSGKVCICSYLFILYQVYDLSRFGGLKNHLVQIFIASIIFLGSFLLWLFNRKKIKDVNKVVLGLEIVIIVVSTLYFGNAIIKMGMPFNGDLSWKINNLHHKRELVLNHDNVFNNGVADLFKDLDEKLKFPKKLYISNNFKITFDQEGTIHTIDTILYGKDKQGKTKTYLISYDKTKSEYITIIQDSAINTSYNEDMRLEPMFRILQKANYQKQVANWSVLYEADLYEMKYYGKNDINLLEGVDYLDDEKTGVSIDFSALQKGGKIKAVELSLKMPNVQDITPVRYIIDAEYISQETIDNENALSKINKAKEIDNWIVDQSSGSTYFFLNDQLGWRLKVIDAALGSRFYALDKSNDGGNSWNRINNDPFVNEIGVSMGLIFLDENIGFAGLTSASQQQSKLFITNDGGITFKPLNLPMDKVTKLPETASECNFTLADYDYFNMPTKKGNTLTILVTSSGDDSEGIIFQSDDNGVTWKYIGIN